MLVDALLAAAGRGGDRPAVADPFRALDYGNLVRLADVMRRQVVKATSRPHVGIMMPSSCAFAGTFYGVLWAGRVAVPLNFLLQPAELRAVVEDAELDTVFAVKYFREQLQGLPVRVIYIEDLPLKREMVLERIRRKPSPPRVSDDDLAVLLYTSGTSGLPKGVRQTYKNLRSDVVASIEKAQLKTAHRFVGVLPQFHSFGLTSLLLIPVELGSPVHHIPRFQATAVLETVRRHRGRVLIMVASMYKAMLRGKKGGREDLASVEYPISGGEALPDAVFDQFKERFGVELLQGYGMTEASPIVSLNVPGANRVGTVGQAIPGVTVAAFDDVGSGSGTGAVGELWIRGPIVMQGYHHKPEETQAAVTAEGWYKTGDMGKVDGEGYISITGRKKEMIIVGGENVYPREVEAVLEQHPAVSEAAVIGVQDAARGEVVVAFATLVEGGEASETVLRDYCRDRLAGYKVPRRVIVSNDLPRSSTGKLLKRRLVELL